MALITPTEAKAFLQISHTDTNIDLFIAAAIEEAEGILGKKTTNDPARSDDVDGGGFSLMPPGRPIDSITSITDLLPEPGSVVDSSIYELRRNFIYKRDGLRWREGAARYRIAYSGGWAEASVPSTVKLAIMQIMFRDYHGRGGQASQLAAGIQVQWEKYYNTNFVKKLKQFSSFGGF